MVLDPDPAGRVASTHPAPPGILTRDDASPHALTILTTEHWSLLASRSMGYTEAMSRAALYIAALSGAVVALALVAQATDFGDGFVAFALVLLPVVFFIGLVTIVRLGQINSEDALWVQGLNRLRHAYLELTPELEPYFVTSRYDDIAGVLASAPRSKPGAGARRPFQAFVATPGLVAVLDSVVAGATAGIAALGLDLGTGAVIAIGAAMFAITLAAFVAYGISTIRAYQRRLVARFPSPPAQ
jgi:hypothetical protein